MGADCWCNGKIPIQKSGEFQTPITNNTTTKMTSIIDKTVKMLTKELDRVKARENATKTEREHLEKAIAQFREGNFPVLATGKMEGKTESDSDNEANSARFKGAALLPILEGMSSEVPWTVSELMEKADKAGLRPQGMDDKVFERKLYSQIHIRLGTAVRRKSSGYGHNEATFVRIAKRTNRK